MSFNKQQLISFFAFGLKFSARLFFIFLLTGCAGFFVRLSPVPADEKEKVTAVFNEILVRHKDCGCCIDADADVLLAKSGLFGGTSGAMTGYLQAMAPSFIKFVALNPLGQPAVIYVSDGNSFRCVLVPEAKGFEGSVHAESFKKYTPPGFKPAEIYYWLTGRLAAVDFDITEIGRADKGAYWLYLQRGEKKMTSQILFDPIRAVILRRIEKDEYDMVVMDVSYEYMQESPSAGQETACSLPREIIVKLININAELVIRLSGYAADADLSANDFDFDLPSGFEQVIVE